MDLNAMLETLRHHYGYLPEAATLKVLTKLAGRFLANGIPLENLQAVLEDHLLDLADMYLDAFETDTKAFEGYQLRLATALSS